MTTLTTSSAARGPGAPPRGSRTLVLTGAVLVALVSTASAYLAMVQFGIDVLGMPEPVAYATAGVFELSLVTVALMAREAATDNRPGGTLLALTWVLSSASGLLAAWHEIFIGHTVGAAVFRFLVPLLAALMWHLALIGDRHLATGHTWSSLRQTARMHALFLATEDLFRAQSLNDGTRAARRRLNRAEKTLRRTRAIALKTVPPEEMHAQVTTWIGSLRAVGDGTADVARLHADHQARMANMLTSAETARDTAPATTPSVTTPSASGAASAADTDAGDTSADTTDDSVVTDSHTAGDTTTVRPAGDVEARDADDTTSSTPATATVPDTRRKVAAAGVPVPRKHVKAQVTGSRQPRLTRVEELRAAGTTPEAIATLLGVSERTIYRDFEKLDAADNAHDTAPADSDDEPADVTDPDTADVTPAVLSAGSLT